jgi:hypothetical protein
MPGGGGFLRLVEAAKLLMIALMAIHQDGIGSKWFATQMSFDLGCVKCGVED